MPAHRRLLPLCIAIVPFLIACDDVLRSSSYPAPVGPAPFDTAGGGTRPSRLDAAAAVFAPDTIRDIELLLAPESLAAIDADPAAERWTTGTLVLDGDTAHEVGIRYKGEEGAWYKCVEGGPRSGGRKICPLNMKVEIDHLRDTTFHGLKMFQLHAMNETPSLLTETMAYWFARGMGVPAPRTAFCRLSINGRFEGLFLHVEDMDARFVEAWQPGSDANLYKEVWPLSWDSSAATESDILASLRTNRSHPDISRFVAFARALAAATDKSTRDSVLGEWVDMDELHAVVALELALDDDDGLFHWYALGEAPGYAARPHNFLWLEGAAAGKFRLLPWDLDKAFTRVADPDVGNAIEIIDPLGGVSNGCRNFGPGWPQRSAACDPLVAVLSLRRALLVQKIQAILDGPFQRSDSALDAWTARLAPVVASLPTDNPQGITTASWQAGVADLRIQIAASRASLLQAHNILPILAGSIELGN